MSTGGFSFFYSDETTIIKEQKQIENRPAKTVVKTSLCVAVVLTLIIGSLGGCAFADDPSAEKTAVSEEARSVIDLIDSIGEVDLDDENLVADCEKAYTALTLEQQAEVSNYNTLVDARNKLDELIASKAKSVEPVKPEEPEPAEEAEEAEEKEPEKDDLWKNAYREYLYDVMAGSNPVPDLLEAFTYDPDQNIRYQLMDITGDDIPELLISGIPYEADDYPYWKAYTLNPEGQAEYLCDFGFYDPETREVFVNDGTSFEGYSVYPINNGKIDKGYYSMTADDSDRYYKVDGESNTYNEISKEEMDDFRNRYNDGYKKYCIKGIALTKENVENDFGVPDHSDEPIDLSGYKKMWIKEECKESYEDMVFENFLDGDSSELFDSIKKADWDNDGIYEYYLEGSVNYSGMYFDMSGDRLTAIYGFGPYGMGWNGVAYIDGAYWVYDASGNSGKFYAFKKYDPRHEISEEFCYQWQYDIDDAGNETVTFAKGSDYENMSEISETEFDEMCGDNGLIYQDLPDLPENGDEKLTNDLYAAVKEFFEGKRPAWGRG